MLDIVVKGGALFFANLANLGDDRWPASPGYYNLMDICQELFEERNISEAELSAIFIPDTLPRPRKCHVCWMTMILGCFVVMLVILDHPLCLFYQGAAKARRSAGTVQASATLAHVVRAWSESSILIGLQQTHNI